MGAVCGRRYRKPGFHHSRSLNWYGTESAPPTGLLGTYSLLRQWRDHRADKRKPGQPASSIAEGHPSAPVKGSVLPILHFFPRESRHPSVNIKSLAFKMFSF